MFFIELGAIYISFLIVTITIGLIKFNEKIMTMLSVVYNIAIGYADTVFFSIPRVPYNGYGVYSSVQIQSQNRL